MDKYNVVDKGDWFKVHHSGWLEGTLRAKRDLPIDIKSDGDKLAAYRGVHADLLALISRSRLRDGTLRHAIGLPMKRQWIADVLNISIELLDAVINDGVNDKNKDDGKHRIEIWDDGTIELTNWHRYQAKTGKTLDKEKARQISIDRAMITKQSKDNAVQALTRSVNETTIATNALRKKIRYIPTIDGDTLDTLTGQMKNKDGE